MGFLKLAKAKGKVSQSDKLDAPPDMVQALVAECEAYQTDLADNGEGVILTKAKRRYAIGGLAFKLTENYKCTLDDCIKHVSDAGVVVKHTEDTKLAGIEPITKGRLAQFKTAARKTPNTPESVADWNEFYKLTRPANKAKKPSKAKLAESAMRSAIKRYFDAHYVDQKSESFIGEMVGSFHELAQEMLVAE
jgi:hypothetical protein